MKKSEVIATCLVNSNFYRSVSEAERVVENVSKEEFPNSNFNFWNELVPHQQAQTIITNVGRASQINIRFFIEDLWN